MCSLPPLPILGTRQYIQVLAATQSRPLLKLRGEREHAFLTSRKIFADLFIDYPAPISYKTFMTKVVGLAGQIPSAL